MRRNVFGRDGHVARRDPFQPAGSRARSNRDRHRPRGQSGPRGRVGRRAALRRRRCRRPRCRGAREPVGCCQRRRGVVVGSRDQRPSPSDAPFERHHGARYRCLEQRGRDRHRGERSAGRGSGSRPARRLERADRVRRHGLSRRRRRRGRRLSLGFRRRSDLGPCRRFPRLQPAGQLRRHAYGDRQPGRREPGHLPGDGPRHPGGPGRLEPQLDAAGTPGERRR